ncbi:MAG: hemolysin family protein [Proteobacteria bacterium]|nr:hemolysin family protein [Pseudomonadota bacterium]
MNLEFEAASLIVLIFLSAFFSGVETAFVSLSEIRLQHLAENKVRGIQLVRKLKGNYQRLIITILIGNNLVNIAASSLATSIAIRSLGSHAVGIAVGGMTFVILVFGEITPKTVAMLKNEWICIHTAPILKILMLVFWPIITFLEILNRVVAKPLKGGSVPLITQEEIKSVVSLGEEIGEVEEDERIMIHNIFRFSDLEASEIMIDRTQIFSVESARTVADVAPEIVRQGYSRVPVYETKPDRMIGILYAKDVLHAMITDKGESPVKDFARPVMFVPETILVDDLLREFQLRKIHMALVVDEHGGVSGLVTIEDLLEEIVGDILDETDRETVQIHKLGKNKALVKGDTEVEEVNRALNLGIDEEADYETISGFILSNLRHIPKVGEQITMDGWVLKITKADSRRILEVEIEKI